MEKLWTTMDIIIKKIFYKSTFYDYEQLCIDTWENSLNDDAKKILHNQLDRVSFIIRFTQKKVVSVGYLKGFSYTTLDENILFPLRTEESNIASIWFRSSTISKQSIRASITIFQGRLTGIEFNKPPVVFFRNLDQITIDRIETHLDPMKSYTTINQSISDVYNLSDWIRDLLNKTRVDKINKPLEPTTRKNLVRRIEAKLPPQYEDLISQVNGIVLPNLRIFPLEEVSTIVLKSGTYYAISEFIGMGFLAVKEGKTDVILYKILNNEPDNAIQLEEDFLTLIRKEL